MTWAALWTPWTWDFSCSQTRRRTPNRTSPQHHVSTSLRFLFAPFPSSLSLIESLDHSPPAKERKIKWISKTKQFLTTFQPTKNRDKNLRGKRGRPALLRFDFGIFGKNFRRAEGGGSEELGGLGFWTISKTLTWHRFGFSVLIYGPRVSSFYRLRYLGLVVDS